MEFIQKYRKYNDYENKEMNIEPKHILAVGAGLEIIRQINEKIDRIELKLHDLENKINSHVPQKILTEERFLEEIQSSEDIVNKIICEVKSLTNTKSITTPINTIIENSNNIKIPDNKISKLNELDDNKPTIVELKRIEKITNLLQKHGKLSSVQLAHLMDLSRTRANEYLKQMETLELVEGTICGKEKYYQLLW